MNKQVYACILLILMVLAINYKYSMLVQAHSMSANSTLYNLHEHLHHGDIILLCKRRLKSVQDIMFRTLACVVLNTPYYHIGIVVERAGEKYILHSTPSAYHFPMDTLHGCDGESIKLAKLHAYLNDYEEQFAGMVKVFRHSYWKHDTRSIFRAAQEMCGYEFQIDPLRLLFPNSSEKKVMACTSFIGMLLEQLGEFEKQQRAYQVYIPGKIEGFLRKANFDEVGEYVLM